ncbi:MAG: ComF family protein, partial [Pseudomonadota bacterium]
LHDGIARRVVHALKYQDRQDLVPMMGLWMARAGAPLIADADVLVPVPLHWLRLMRRGFNQSDVLAGAVARRSGLPVAQGLKRTRRTRQQVRLSGAARRRNVAGAFAVRDSARPAIAGRRVVLIDDVITTGATVHACTRALLRAGATSVDVLAFSRVPAETGPDEPLDA